MLESLKKHLRVYWLYFLQYWKTRMVYKTDFLLGFLGQLINLGTSLAFLGLIFTQVESLQGWTLNELLFLAGVGGIVMNLHHTFMLQIYSLGENFIIEGNMDRVLVRPLNPLFQVYSDSVSDDNISKLIANIFIVVIAGLSIGINVTTIKIVYAAGFLVSGTLTFGAMYLAFSTLAFWTGRSKEFLWILFSTSDFRRYPFSIYPMPIKILLVTLLPFALAAYFPTLFFLGRNEYQILQFLSIIAGPALYIGAYSFWKYGLSKYSSTGS